MDAPGFHYVGVLNSTDACAATCESAAEKCSIWLFSRATHHCFWRLDGVWNPDAQGDVDSGCRSTSAAGAACIAGCGGCPVAPIPPFIPTTAKNMNGDYLLSPTPKGPNVQEKFPTQFKDYPRGVESFDIYSPLVRTYYSQVFWKGLPPVALPKDIVERYHGIGMAVVGFEMDQVRKTPDGDVSVPINVAYNHHFESNMIGGFATFEHQTFTGPEDPRLVALLAKRKGMNMAHGLPSHDEAWVVANDGVDEQGLPSSVQFSGANGGEYRKSFHGYAPGYVQVLRSPTAFQITPMQIDTWHRDAMNLTGPTKFVAGPLPRSSLAAPDAKYSGLLECPLTTRIEKVVDVGYTAQSSGFCPSGKAIETAELCWAAVRNYIGYGTPFATATGSAAAQPDGCSIGYDATTAGPRAYFGTAATAAASGAACGANAATLEGQVRDLVALRVVLDAKNDLVTLNLTGPADAWFGVGFNASAMKDAPWAVIVEAPASAGGAPTVSERKLAAQSPGSKLVSSITVVSTSVANGMRTVVATRALKGATVDHYTFDPSTATKIALINAVGASPSLSYHKAKGPTTISLLPRVAPGSAAAGVCVCNGDVVPFGEAKVSLLLCTVTLYANHAHNLTRSPEHL